MANMLGVGTTKPSLTTKDCRPWLRSHRTATRPELDDFPFPHDPLKPLLWRRILLVFVVVLVLIYVAPASTEIRECARASLAILVKLGRLVMQIWYSWPPKRTRFQVHPWFARLAAIR